MNGMSITDLLREGNGGTGVSDEDEYVVYFFAYE